MILFSDYRSLLCLNGDLPGADFFRKAGLPIIAADGAANTLMSMGICPQVVIGDLDSVDPVWKDSLSLLHRPDQNACDFEKAMEYLQAQDLLPTVILGVNGGYLDHILNNVNLLMNTQNVLYAPPITGWVLQKGCCKTLELPIQTKLSLIGIPHAVASSTGLQWELQDYVFNFPGRNSCFNRSIHPSVAIQVTEGNVLLLVYSDL